MWCAATSVLNRLNHFSTVHTTHILQALTSVALQMLVKIKVSLCKRYAPQLRMTLLPKQNQGHTLDVSVWSQVLVWVIAVCLNCATAPLLI